ncbi:hypothetical protein Droror1_Dr00024986 [Drosera rotundifolia]
MTKNTNVMLILALLLAISTFLSGGAVASRKLVEHPQNVEGWAGMGGSFDPFPTTTGVPSAPGGGVGFGGFPGIPSTGTGRSSSSIFCSFPGFNCVTNRLPPPAPKKP